MFLVCFAFMSPAIAQNNRVPLNSGGSQTRSGSIITGRAFFEDTNEPATRERVQLIVSEALNKPAGRLRIPTAITDQNGQFELKFIAAGDYYVVARPADEHVTANELFPFLHPTGDSAADAAKLEAFRKQYVKITVDGQNSLTVDLHVWNPHYGRISGHVYDSEGKPAIRSSVHLMPAPGQGVTGESTPTNEAGEYTFFGLAAGDYIVSANPPPKSSDQKAPPDFQWLAGAVTYYPSVLQRQESAPVSVISDRETANIDIHLIPRRLHTIAGVVRMRGSGDPVTAGRLRLVRNQGANVTTVAPSVSYTSSDARGNWSFSNVPDGAYQIVVEPVIPFPDDTNKKFVPNEQAVAVNGDDISDLVIEVSSGIRISGKISFEGDLPVSVSLIASRRLSPAQTSITVTSVQRVTDFQLFAAPDGTIDLTPHAQPARLFYVKAIEARGVDLLSSPLEAAEGSDVQDVHILISSQVATLSGRVLSAEGTPASEVMVTLIPKLGDKRVIGGQPSGRTDAKGEFNVTVPPGEYSMQVARAVKDSQTEERRFSVSHPDNAQRIALAPGERKVLNITVQ
jgi:Carboxypeptidase regulatory-like domain